MIVAVLGRARHGRRRPRGGRRHRHDLGQDEVKGAVASVGQQWYVQSNTLLSRGYYSPSAPVVLFRFCFTASVDTLTEVTPRPPTAPRGNSPL